MARLLPKTLAKTLAYIACHAPGEHGLFWDPDGTMPWKEFYWALQEDPSLRHVKEANVKEFEYLGIEVPFELDGNLLRLKDRESAPDYSAGDQPQRLFFALRPKQYRAVVRQGLELPANRSYLPLATDAELALRIGRRREARPILVEVHAERAALEAGVVFLDAGGSLYLATAPLPREFVVLPKVPDEVAAPPAPKNKKTKPAPDREPYNAGSSLVLGSSGFRDLFGQEVSDPAAQRSKRGKKGGKGSDWKRERRQERRKREP
jgi:putative RNA 2'-phosphotransferase